MARPSRGVRRQIGTRMPVALIEQIDAVRGPLSRDVWLEHAARLALRPGSQIVSPELRQEVHQHTPARLKRTEMRGDVKLKIHVCECGEELVGR